MIVIKMEIADTDLEKIIQKHLVSSLAIKLDMLKQMIKVLYCLKTKKINHLDIKP